MNVLAAADTSVHLGGGETVVFWILGPIALAGALGMVLSRNAVHSALWLVNTMLALGVFYVVQEAPFRSPGEKRASSVLFPPST